MMLPNHTNRLLRFAWVLALIVVIAGSLLPGNSLPMLELARLHINDKIQHLMAYAVLAFLPAIHEKRKFLLTAALAMVMMGVFLEFGQFAVGRDFEIGDMAADAVGGLTGAALGLPLRDDRKLAS